SHGTYYFLAAGCYISIGNKTKAQALLDVIPDLIDKKKISGKDLPTEVLIKKK
ncbi:Mitochondrial outer membrane protein iml2, partial [Blastosporella zonata]